MLDLTWNTPCIFVGTSRSIVDALCSIPQAPRNRSPGLFREGDARVGICPSAVPPPRMTADKFTGLFHPILPYILTPSRSSFSVSPPHSPIFPSLLVLFSIFFFFTSRLYVDLLSARSGFPAMLTREMRGNVGRKTVHSDPMELNFRGVGHRPEFDAICKKRRKKKDPCQGKC